MTELGLRNTILLQLLPSASVTSQKEKKITTKDTQNVPHQASQVALVAKILPASTGDVRDMGSILELGRSPGEGHRNPLQYSCLENPMDRGTWQATVHRITQSWTQLK